jgi:class II aldolase/adducin N-terminal domain-containing protein
MGKGARYAILTVAAFLPWLADEARAANNAYAVDSADIGETGSCKIESWLSSATNTDFTAVANPSCVVDPFKLKPVELSLLTNRAKSDGEWSTSLAPKAKVNLVPTGVGKLGVAFYQPIRHRDHGRDCESLAGHSIEGTRGTVSSLKEGLLPLSQTAMRFHGRVGYHEFEGPAISGAECDRVVRDLGEHDVLLLRNHGLLARGRTIPPAFNAIYWLENACRFQVDLLGCNRAVHQPSPAAIENTVTCFAGQEITLLNEADTNPALNADARQGTGGYGSLEWAALLRKLDRLDPSFRS